MANNEQNRTVERVERTHSNVVYQPIQAIAVSYESPLEGDTITATIELPSVPKGNREHKSHE